MRNLKTTTPEAPGACHCSKGQVSILCPRTLTSLDFSNAPQEYFLSKASVSLAGILSICVPTEVALDKSYWAEETAQKLTLPSSMRP